MCSGCSTPLCVDSESSGQIIECPGCKENVLVPEAKCKYQCAKCQAELSSPAGMAGSSIDCPFCDTEIKVPPPSKEKPKIHLKPSIQGSRTSTKDGSNSNAGKTINCPKCHFAITFSQAQIEQSLRDYTPYACPQCGEGVVIPGSPPPRLCPYCAGRITNDTIMCVHCGINLHTGQRVVNSSSSSGNNAYISEKRILPLFLLYLFCGVIGVHNFYAGRIGRGCFYLFGFLLNILYMFFGLMISDDPNSFKIESTMMLVALIAGGVLLLLYFVCILVDLITILSGYYRDGNGNRITKWT